MAIRRSVSALFFVTLLSAPALADIPPGPGPGPPPAECTAQSMASSHDQCVDCSASYEQPNKCQELASQGYRQACRAQGASVWNEVWCRSGGGQPEQRRGCGACAVGTDEASSSMLAMALAALGALAWAARRR